MSWILCAAALYRLVFQRQRLEQELDAEVESYFEILVNRYMEQGMSREEARRAARVRPEHTFFDAQNMKDIYYNRAVKEPNLIVEVIVWMGIMGLVLAVIGLYGLVAHSVSRRTREIGIRMAIGADRTSVMKMVLKQGLMLGVTGVAAGLAMGIFACRAITSGGVLSFGHISMLPFAAVSLLLILTTTAATYIPARRASRIDPLQALREE